MSAEHRPFICRNNSCNPKDPTGGIVFIHQTEVGDPFACPKCKSVYEEIDGKAYFKAVNEKSGEFVLDSIEAFEDFVQQYETKEIYFPKLVIKDIIEPKNPNRPLSFGQCRFDELILENIDITSASFPVSFIDCVIKKLSIQNLKIKDSGRKDYKSLWHFFGLNFFRSRITDDFNLTGANTKLMIEDCELTCTININNNSKIDLAWLHNDKEPILSVDKKSKVVRLFEVIGRNSSVTEKKIKAGSKEYKGIKADELHIDPTTEGKSVFENCSFKKLILPDDGDVRLKLIFTNCYIGSIENEPHTFERDIIFFGCVFNEDVSISRAISKQSLIFEACLFEKDAVFNDLIIDRDIHLNYSFFKNKLSISNNTCGGYIKTQFAILMDGIEIEDNLVSREVSISQVKSLGDIVLKNNEIKGYLFIRQVNIDGNLKINWLTTHELDISDISVNGGFEFLNSHLKSNLRLKEMNISGDTTFNFIKNNGDILTSSCLFHGNFGILACDSLMNFFINNEVRGSFELESNIFENQTHIQRSLIISKFTWKSNDAHNLSITENQIWGEFQLSKSKANDTHINDNILLENMEINGLMANDLYLIDTFVSNEIKLFNIEIGDLISKHIGGKSFKISNGTYSEITISDCKDVDEMILNNIKASKDVTLEKNTLAKNLEIKFCKVEADLTVQEVTTAEEITLLRSHADMLKVSNAKAKTLSIRRGKYRQVEIENNQEIQGLILNYVTISKDVIFQENSITGEFEMYFCSVENDLEFVKNTFQSNVMLSNNTISGALNQTKEKIEGYLMLVKNLIRGNLVVKEVDFGSEFYLSDNTVEQLFHIFDPIQGFPYPVTIIRNKFTYVELGACLCQANFNFDENNVFGRMQIGKKDSDDGNKLMQFMQAASFCENRVRSVFFINVLCNAPVCMHNNFIERDLTFTEFVFDEVLDMTGSFVGGSALFSKTAFSGNDGALILDNTFIDKKTEFINCRASNYSFKNATFNGFSIPDDWKISFWTGKFISRATGTYILEENRIQKEGLKKTSLPYSLIKSHIGNTAWYPLMHEIWSHLQWFVFQDDAGVELIKNVPHGEAIFKLRDNINECISKSFYPAYYGFLRDEEMDELENLADSISNIDTTHENETAEITLQRLRQFFESFKDALVSFRHHSIFGEGIYHQAHLSTFKNDINESQKEQFKVLRQIFGSDGDLVNEDRSYNRWMHFKNVANRKSAFLQKKPLVWTKFWLKGILFEKIFGWGVNLPRIVLSTIFMVGLFSLIYYLIFAANPGLEFIWDNKIMTGSDVIGWKPIVFAIQTTFSAGLGDWAPIGSGPIKVPMTINAVLGVLFVTFLIGAYGRKMLR